MPSVATIYYAIYCTYGGLILSLGIINLAAHLLWPSNPLADTPRNDRQSRDATPQSDTLRAETLPSSPPPTFDEALNVVRQDAATDDAVDSNDAVEASSLAGTTGVTGQQKLNDLAHGSHWALALSIAQYATLVPGVWWSSSVCIPILASRIRGIITYTQHSAPVHPVGLLGQLEAVGLHFQDDMSNQDAIIALLVKEFSRRSICSIIEITVAILWSMVALSPLHDLISLLTTRWLHYYSSPAVLIRILTSITLLFYSLGFIFRILNFGFITPTTGDRPKHLGTTRQPMIGQRPQSRLDVDLFQLARDKRSQTILLIWVILTFTVTFFRDLVGRTSSSVQETRRASIAAGGTTAPLARMRVNSGSGSESRQRGDPTERADGQSQQFRARPRSPSTRGPFRRRKSVAVQLPSSAAVVVVDEPLIHMSNLTQFGVGTLGILLLARILL